VDAQRRVALNYFEDGSVDAACPPLKALLHIMAYGFYQAMTLDDLRFRALFNRETVLQSDWYRERLQVKQERDMALWRRHLEALEKFQQAGMLASAACDFSVEERTREARLQLARVSSGSYLTELRGTIGADPFTGQRRV
jgi:phosphoenolpyruvate carboxykinase (diphosphate)